jgi:hypothetical protein
MSCGLGSSASGIHLLSGAERSNPLADFPGLAFLFEFVLQVTGGKVNAEGDGIVVAVRQIRVARSARFCIPVQHNFALVVQVFGEIRVKKRLVVHH